MFIPDSPDRCGPTEGVGVARVTCYLIYQLWNQMYKEKRLANSVINDTRASRGLFILKIYHFMCMWFIEFYNILYLKNCITNLIIYYFAIYYFVFWLWLFIGSVYFW